MALQPEERAAITTMVNFMSQERGKTYHVHENPNDPPDVIADEAPGSRRIGIEHTRIIPQDRESIEAWQRFRGELGSVTPPHGTYVVGPAELDTRFPRVAGSLGRVVKHVLEAIRAHWTWTPGTSITVPNEPQIKVTMIGKTGSDLIGLSPLSRQAWPKVLSAMRGRLDMKIEGIDSWAPVDERILLMDATSASAITHRSLGEHLYDELWFLHRRGLLPFDRVYFVRGTDVRRVWPK